MHADFLRVVADHKLTAHVPLHFINEEVAVGVKQSGGEISHTISEVEVSPAERPAGIHRSRHGQGRAGPDRSPVGPQGSERRRAGTLAHGNDLAVTNIHASRVVKEEGSEEGAAE